MAAGLIQGGEFKDLTSRGISEETCRKFGYQVVKLGDGRVVQLAPYTNAEGQVVAQKVRPKDKDKMFMTGDAGDILLFGQNLWGSGGRKIVVTEGELDAMSVSQAQGNKWPVVSIPKGAKAARKELAKQLTWLCSFEEVVLMFDMDDPGKEASIECAGLFPPGKCKLASLPLKDASDMLQAGRSSELVQAIWNAKPYRPDGIVTLDDIFEEVLEDPAEGLPWFLPTLTKLTFGRRYGENFAFGAGTGIGKTDLFTQQMQYDITELGQKVAVFALEQRPKQTLRRIAGKLWNKCFHIPDGSWTKDDLRAALVKLKDSGKLFLYDNFGSADWDIIRDTMRYLALSEGVRLFYLDHLTALVAEEDDEKKALEKLMAQMSMLCEELQIIVHFISHLTTPDGTPHEEGGRVTIRQFKGSRAIGYWSHFMFGMERNQQHDDPRHRSITTFRVLKDRNTGRATGEHFYLGYEKESGRLFETELPEGERFGDETKTPSADNPDF